MKFIIGMRFIASDGRVEIDKKKPLKRAVFPIKHYEQTLCLCNRLYRNKRFTVSTFLESYGSINQGEQGMILAHTYIQTGIVDGTSLADDDVTGFGKLTAKNLNA